MSDHEYLDSRWVALSRALLGIVFLYASFGKILDPQAFAGNLLDYQIFSSPWTVRFLAAVLPWVEWFCGVCLLLGIFVRSVAWLTFTLIVTFLGAMISARWRGLSIVCGCFGSAKETIGAITFLRDGFFLVLSLLLLLSRPDSFSLQALLASRRKARTVAPVEQP